MIAYFLMPIISACCTYGLALCSLQHLSYHYVCCHVFPVKPRRFCKKQNYKNIRLIEHFEPSVDPDVRPVLHLKLIRNPVPYSKTSLQICHFLTNIWRRQLDLGLQAPSDSSCLLIIERRSNYLIIVLEDLYFMGWKAG